MSSNQPIQLMVELNSSLRHIIVTFLARESKSFKSTFLLSRFPVRLS